MTVDTSITPTYISSFSAFCRGPYLNASSGSIAGESNRNYGANNLAIYVPLLLPFDYPVARMFFANGNAVAGNIDLGLYTSAGVRLASTGATAQAGVLVLQYITLSQTLTAGAYYMAAAMSNTAGAVRGTNFSAAFYRTVGLLQQAAALPLPANATFATYAQVMMPFFGVTRTAS